MTSSLNTVTFLMANTPLGTVLLCLQAFAFTAVFAHVTSAQESPFLQSSSIGLTFQQALDQLNKTNLSVLNAENKLLSAQKQENVFESAYYPTVIGTINGTEYDKKQLSTDSKYSVQSQLSLTQNLFSGFSDQNKINQARENTKASLEILKNTKSKAYAELKQVYQKNIYSKDFIRLADKISQRRQDNYRLVELRFNSGRENKGNVFLFKAYTEQALLEKLQAENTASNSHWELAKTLGYDQNIKIEVLDSKLPMATLPEKPDYFGIVLEHPEYKASVAQEEATQFEYNASKSKFMPSLDLSASYTYSDTNFFPQRNEGWNAGLTLSFPFFSGGRDVANSQSSFALWKAQSSAKALTEKQILLGLKTAYTNYQEALQKLRVDQSFREAASVRADIAKNKYNNGLLTFESWDQVENDFILREKNLLASQRDLVYAEANWLQAQGLDSNEGLKDF
ncbi:MAG: TolC family protein [Pseudobdellovibrionaceae bacterium]